MFAKVGKQCLVCDATRIGNDSVRNTGLTKSANDTAALVAQTDHGALMFPHHGGKNLHLVEVRIFYFVVCFNSYLSELIHDLGR